MKKQEPIALVHNFSTIPGLQTAHSLSYQVTMSDQGPTIDALDSSAPPVSLLLPGQTLERGVEILRFLCENVVAPGQCADVLRDCGIPFRDPCAPPERPPKEIARPPQMDIDFPAPSVL